MKTEFKLLPILLFLLVALVPIQAQSADDVHKKTLTIPERTGIWNWITALR
jgi:hypothetical protein